MTELPLKTLSKSKGSIVAIRLKNNLEYKGRLIESDAMMNVILEDAQEFTLNENGELKLTKGLGRVFLRGNNVLFVKLGEK